MKLLFATFFLALGSLSLAQQPPNFNARIPSELQGRKFNTDFDELKFTTVNKGVYDVRGLDGKFLVTSVTTQRGQFVLSGLWNEAGSGDCHSVIVDQGRRSTNWGNFRFEFQIAADGQYLNMRGKYSFCDAEPTRTWNGKLLPISQDLRGLRFETTYGDLDFRSANFAKYPFNDGAVGPSDSHGAFLNKRTLVLNSFWSEQKGTSRCSSLGGPFQSKTRRWGKLRFVFSLKNGGISSFEGYYEHCNATPATSGRRRKWTGTLA